MTLLTETRAEECEIGLYATAIRDVNGSQWGEKKKTLQGFGSGSQYRGREGKNRNIL